MPKILAFSGSARKDSFNQKLVQIAAQGSQQSGAEVTIVNLADYPMPIFNQDLEIAEGMPQHARAFKELLIEHEGFLIASPEYNSAFSPLLKNAIDWASRPSGDNTFEGKPVAIMSASTGMLGGARAQYHLRQSFVFLKMYPINSPEVFVTFARQKFDEDGRLLDEKAKELIRELIESLAAWARKLKQANN